MEHLVDLSALKDLAGPRPSPGLLDWAGRVSRVHLSALTLEEMESWLGARPVARLREWLDGFLERHVEVVPVDADIARRAGEMRGWLLARGESRTRATVLVAATAAQRSLTLVTRTPRAFAGLGVAVLDPGA